MTARALWLVAALSATSTAHAWTDTGHMLVSAIAERGLKPEVRSKLAELLQNGGDAKTQDLLGAACWADDTKTQANGPWHYINYHFRRDGQPTENLPAEENVLWAISKFSDAMIDGNRPATERADALRYVLHFVGDVHQPLHCVACDSEQSPKGDRGGNDFTFDPFPVGTYQVKNLHFLWDIGGGLYGDTPRPLTDRTSFDQLRDRIIAQHPRDTMPEVGIEDPEKWAEEGLMLAKTLVYATQQTRIPSESYLATVQFVSARRIALAGYRLANLLNGAFAEEAELQRPTSRS